MRTHSVSSHSIFGTPARERLSRSHSPATGLADQIRQILWLELRSGRDRRIRSQSSSQSRSRSSSGWSSNSRVLPLVWTQSDLDSSPPFLWLQPLVQPLSTNAFSSFGPLPSLPRHHGRRFHSCRRSDCSRSHSPRRRARPRDSIVSHSPPLLVRCRALRVTSLWALRRPLKLSRPLRSPPPFSRLLLLPRPLRGMLRGSLSL